MRNIGFLVMELSRTQVVAPRMPMGIFKIRQRNPSLQSQVLQAAGTLQIRWISTQRPGTFAWGCWVMLVMLLGFGGFQQAMEQTQQCRNRSFDTQNTMTQGDRVAAGLQQSSFFIRRKAAFGTDPECELGKAVQL